jgi:putative DNA primase/helicase
MQRLKPPNSTLDVTRIERAALGAVLVDQSTWPRLSELNPDDFSLDAHRRIFSTMLELTNRRLPIEILSLRTELEGHGELEKIGGAAYLSKLVEDTVPENVHYYVATIKDAASRRKLARGAENVRDLSMDPTANTSVIVAAVTSLTEIGRAIDPVPPPFSEDKLALRFSTKHADNLRYVAQWKCWKYFDGIRWVNDDTLYVLDLARCLCRAASAECGDLRPRVAMRLASKATASAVETLAAADRRHAATTDQWDADSWLLNTPTGTIDLRTGKLRQHTRADYITKCTAAGLGEECPEWLRFLDRVTGGDEEMQSYLQRVAGYVLTGSTREQVLFFLHGTGANGKSVFLSTVAGLLNDYARSIPTSTLTVGITEPHPTDLAGLRGARLVIASETEDGAKWAESKIKTLTGGDKIAARFMRCDFFEFTPEFKLVIAGNHKPSLRSVDEAVRRRFQLVPFAETIPLEEREQKLSENLRSEYPGILRWAVEGCMAWQLNGLDPPTKVRDATADYLAAEDLVGRWLDDRCVPLPGCRTSVQALFLDWQIWCHRLGEHEGSTKRFSQQLQSHGFRPDRTGSSRGFLGIALQRDVMG